MSDQDDWIANFTTISSLREHPEIAAHVGYYIAAFAGLEGVLWLLYAKVLGIAEQKAMHLLGAIQSFTLKLDAVQRYSQFADYEETKRAALTEVFDATRECNTFRNKLAHGWYLTDERRSGVMIQEHATDPTKTKKARLFQLSQVIIDHEIAKIDKILLLINIHFLGAWDRPD